MQSMFVRRLHTLPRLPVSAEGIPGLYSPSGFRVAWTDYQQFVLNKLNRVIVDTENETRVPFHIMQATKSKPDQAHIFNYASMAHNNHLFFSTLKTSTSAASAPTGVLAQKIIAQFGDLEGLKRAIDQAASKILSSGFVFLVENQDKKLEVVTSLATGSPTTFSRSQTLDLNGQISEDSKAQLDSLQEKVDAREINWNIELLALNLWEHAYLPDYGVRGRQDYIDAWWKSIDWNKVDDRLFKGRI